MPIVFGISQIISHGFGLFLFAALVPLIQESIPMNHWHIATITIMTQISYLIGALLLGFIGPKIGSARLIVGSGIITSSLLFFISQVDDVAVLTTTLTVLAASASISWGAIVEVIGRYSVPEHCSTCMSSAASGTAWGYALNGLIVLLIVPILGWRNSWVMAAMIGVFSVILAYYYLRYLQKSSGAKSAIDESALPENRVSAAKQKIELDSGVKAAELLRIVIREPVAFLACLICLLVGFAAMPFSSWLAVYFKEIGAPIALSGYTWVAAGVTGMISGYCIGKLADSKGHGLAFLVVFTLFSISLIAFIIDPQRFALVVGFGYGMMYFPMWGIVSAWLNSQYSSVVTMQITSIGMVVFGLGGSVGNLITTLISDYFHSLQVAYYMYLFDALFLVALSLYIVAKISKKDASLVKA